MGKKMEEAEKRMGTIYREIGRRYKKQLKISGNIKEENGHDLP